MRSNDRSQSDTPQSSLTPFFNPRSVAVIGASRNRGSIGSEILHNIISYGYRGSVYPVNTAGGEVAGMRAYPSVEDIPEPVDLAVVVVPARFVLDVAASCHRKGVKALVVISAGFGESGVEGRRRQDELVSFCRDAGMRLIGPNCMGIANTDPRVRLHATFSPLPPPPGSVGLLTQSGALGLAIIDYATSLSLGLSTFISYGNKADVSGNDLLTYWENDPTTEVILMYLESFGNPRKFSTLARRIGRTKPIVAVKSGRTVAGARATSSHTGALISTSDVTVDALFHQCGVIRTDTLEELFEVASFLSTQPLPQGRRVAIVTNAGGPGIMCADACEALGLSVAELTPASQAALREFLPAEASVRNPVDMIASASAEQYERTLRVVANDPNVDALIVIFIPPLVTKSEAVAEATARAAATIGRKKPLIGVFMSSAGAPPQLQSESGRIPAYRFPESAARIYAHAAHFAEWRATANEPIIEFSDTRPEEARAIVREAIARGSTWLSPAEVVALLQSFRLPLVPHYIAASPAEAEALAATIGGPTALKAFGPDLIHKTEHGAVQLNLTSPADVARAARSMESSLHSAGLTISGYVLQPMVKSGTELIIGVVSDPLFGPVVACGAGGVMVELLRDVQVRLTPLTARDASQMVRNLKSYPLLTGYRGRPPGDVGAVEDILLRLGALVEAVPEIAELDFNPVIVSEHGAVIVDARVKLNLVEPHSPVN